MGGAAVTRRLVMAWGGGGVVILGAVAAALTNELHAGWGWRIAAGVVVLVWAVVAGWIAFHTGAGEERVTVADTGVYTEGKIGRDVYTRATGVPARGSGEVDASGSGITVGRGAVFARDDIDGGVSTEVHFGDEPRRERPEGPRTVNRPVGPPSPPRPSRTPSHRPQPPGTC
jgi:hypothetical protein